MYVQICCFANLNLLLFCRSRCRRRHCRRCLFKLPDLASVKSVETFYRKYNPDLGSDRSSAWNFSSHTLNVIRGETNGGVAKFRLFSQANSALLKF